LTLLSAIKSPPFVYDLRNANFLAAGIMSSRKFATGETSAQLAWKRATGGKDSLQSQKRFDTNQ
jgi:hypothetical protein